jgi:spoIIIJ-associated protein
MSEQDASMTEPNEPAPMSDADAQELAVQLTAGMLERMGYAIQINSKILPPAPGESETALWIDVRCPEAERLLEYRNEGLDALQMLVQTMWGHKAKSRMRITIDLNGVREEHQQKLAKMAERIAERVQQTGRPVMLEPMIPSERRIIHLTLREHAGVMTESTGEGGTRRVVVKPRV